MNYLPSGISCSRKKLILSFCIIFKFCLNPFQIFDVVPGPVEDTKEMMMQSQKQNVDGGANEGNNLLTHFLALTRQLIPLLSQFQLSYLLIINYHCHHFCRQSIWFMHL